MDSVKLSPRTAGLLGYAGLIPFVLAAVAIHGPWPGAALSARVFISYGAVILAFLGGIQWGLALSPGIERATERVVVGVLPSLLAWSALFLLPTTPATVALATGFVALLLWERRRCPVATPAWYAGLRTRLTLVVLVCHGVALAGIVTHY
ncbi:MAG: DUF3429 domain-containing protein [Halofilum sp. (in: g-proteobacteria)]|nr:DUF3429 domain-containing protein [Halofilum sp. (in: g-proteobacteria)]